MLLMPCVASLKNRIILRNCKHDCSHENHHFSYSEQHVCGNVSICHGAFSLLVSLWPVVGLHMRRVREGSFFLFAVMLGINKIA